MSKCLKLSEPPKINVFKKSNNLTNQFEVCVCDDLDVTQTLVFSKISLTACVHSFGHEHVLAEQMIV